MDGTSRVILLDSVGAIIPMDMLGAILCITAIVWDSITG